MSTFEADAQRVFSDDKHSAYGDVYLSGVRDNWERTVNSIGRDFVAIVILIAAFLLLLDTKSAKLTVLGLEIDNIGLIREFLPCLISYCTFDLSVRYQREMTYGQMYRSAIMVLYPELANSMLVRGPMPAVQPIAGAGYSKASRRLNWTIVLLVVMGPPFFVVYAYVIQIAKYALSLPIILSAIISLLFISYAVVIAMESITSDDDKMARSV
jgi:uncharacterized protein with PQ loop repeat